MSHVLLAHAYYLRYDPKQTRKMKPYPPLGLLYISAHLKAQGFSVELFDTTFAKPAELEAYIRREKPPIVGIYSNLMTRQQVLRDLFTEAGCSGDHLTNQSVKRAKVPNLICILPGETESAIITGAHFDFASQGKGVVDNWSGASMLPSLFESLKTVPRRHTFVFIGFTDEEKGLVGSKSYLKQLSKEDRRKISAMVNLDSLGTSTTKLETDRGDKRLTAALAAVVAYIRPFGLWPIACCMYRSNSACVISSRFRCTTFSVSTARALDQYATAIARASRRSSFASAPLSRVILVSWKNS